MMYCVDCKFFHRLDMRFSPGRVVCEKSGLIDELTDSRRGCEFGRMKASRYFKYIKQPKKDKLRAGND